MEESCDEINGECAVLEAIYWDCSIAKKRHTYKNYSELELQISLLPITNSPSEDVYVQVELCLTIPTAYPRVTPRIDLKNAGGLSDAQLTELLFLLTKLSSRLIGQLMLHELCHVVRLFLSQHNERPMSCHEEMMQTQRKKNRDLEVEKQLRLEELCVTENDEIKRIEMELKEKKEGFRKLKKPGKKKLEAGDSDEVVHADVDKGELRNNNFIHKLEDVFQFPEADELTGSRLKDDFEMLEKLGQGGFGDVLKVQNKLDGRYYAIKRIPLDPRNREVTSKITREVKLLSRLNHENVVRYYNSWLETWEGSRTSQQSALKGSEKVTTDSSDDLFEYSSQEESEASTIDDDPTETTSQSKSNSAVSQYLYIQMEYCERSTLKDVIEAGVYEDEVRVWRLFREVVEGLVHIHDQGIIHRDLKPVNIFMDSNNRPKIGDFGLATSSSECAADPSNRGRSESKRSARDFLQRSLTSNIGTVLYASPEVVNMQSCYNQKVDLYSVGIILFEMAYKRFQTGMERNNVLSNLRKPSIKMPHDADKYIGASQLSIIQWLLNHSSSKRPTARELLSSEHLPPPPFDEQYFDQTLISAVKNSKSHAHKSLLQTIFSQSTTTAVEYTYDHYLTKGHFLTAKKNLSTLISSLTSVFSLHGAVHVDTPFLFPYPNTVYSDFEDCAKFMNQAGNLVVLPHDTKVAFARFIEKTNTERLKRFHVGKLFRENLLNELHPRETWVASYDVIAPSNNDANVLNDLDLFLVLSDILGVLQVSEKQYEVRLQHRAITTAILLHCGVSKDKHHSAFLILNDNKNTNQRKAKLEILGLDESGVGIFSLFTQKDGSLAEVTNHLKPITNHSTPESCLIKSALAYLEKLISLLEACGIKFKTTISLSLTNEINLYSGFSFQFSRTHKRRVDVVGVGGCFSALSQYFRPLGKVANSNRHAVGMTLYLDKLLTDPTVAEDLQKQRHVDVVVMTYQPSGYLTSIVSILRSLRAQQHRCVFYWKEDVSFDDVKNHCKLHNIPYLVLVDSDLSLYKIDEKDRLLCREKTEFKLLESLKKRSYHESEGKSRKGSMNEEASPESGVSASSPHGTPHVEVKLLGSSLPYCFANKVLQHTHESLIKFRRQTEVKILVIELQKRILKSIASQIELKEHSSLFSNINAVCKEFPRERKHIMKVADEVIALNLKKNQILILYSASDDYYKVIL